MKTGWESSGLALEWSSPRDPSRVVKESGGRGRGGGLGKLSAWERLAPGGPGEVEEAPKRKNVQIEKEEVVKGERTRRYYRPRLTENGRLRRAAAASNTSPFIAQAQQRAARRAAAAAAAAAATKEKKIKDRPITITPPRKPWDLTPLQKLCDNDAKRVASIEKRRRALEEKNNRRFGHRVSIEDQENSLNEYSALATARASIQAEKRQASTSRQIPTSLAMSPRSDSDDSVHTRGHHVSRIQIVYDDPHASECIGEPRSSRSVVRTSAARRSSRGTSPFEARALAAALRAYDQQRKEISFQDTPSFQQDNPKSKDSAWKVSPPKFVQYTHPHQYSAVEDMGLLARAVAGLVGSAAKTVELHEDAQRRAQQREHTLASFHFWQERAQRQLDASLRMQQQQFAVSMAELQARAATLQPPPPAQTQSQNSPPESIPAQTQEKTNPEEPAYLPFGGATPFLSPSEDHSLIERLWEKLAEIEEDERAAAAALTAKKKITTTTTTLQVPTQENPSQFSQEQGSVSLPLGLVSSLIINHENTTEDKWIAATTTCPRQQPIKPEPPAPSHDLLAIDADVPATASIRIHDYRDKYRRFRKLLETDLLDTGLSQTTIVDVLADDILQDLLKEASDHVDAALLDCSETILARA